MRIRMETTRAQPYRRAIEERTYEASPQRLRESNMGRDMASLGGASFCRGLAARRLLLSGGLGNDQLIRLADQVFKFLGGEDAGALQEHPLITSDVGRGSDPINLQQFVKFLGRALETNRRQFALRQFHHSKNLPVNLEAEIFAPLHVLSGVGKGETELSDIINVGHLPMINPEESEG